MKALVWSILLILGLACVAAMAQTPSAAQRGVGAGPSSLEPVGPVPGPGRLQPALKNPFEGDDAAVVAGRKLFVSFNCSGCHGGRAGGGMGPSLRDEDWMYGSEPADIFDSIAKGRAHGMPAWGVLMPPQYIWQLVSYIESLRTAREPDPPR
jgi:cytochrome c oxidase cbb3-type subunit III